MPVQSADAAGQSVRSVAEEYSTAEDAFRAGRVDLGIQALERAANQGSLRAMLRLGNLYDDGKIVARDELKACELYSVAADKFSRVDKFYPAAHLVAEAFRRAGLCYVKGLNAPGWDRNLPFAAELFHQAGVILEDPVALFELGKLYLTGENQYQNAALGARHLEAAARKGYPPAQAMLGFLMWEGKVMKRRPAAGLALLILGKEAMSVADRAWIMTLYDDALMTASDDLEREALVLVDKWRSIYGDPAGNSIQTAAPPAMQEIPTPTRAPGKEDVGLAQSAPSGKGPEQYSSEATGANIPADASGNPGGQ